MKNKYLLFISGAVLIMIVTLATMLLITFGSGSCLKSDFVIHIPTGSSYSALIDTLSSSEAISSETHINRINRVARLKKFDKHVKSGRYELYKGMSANEIVNMLHSGAQAPTQLTFNNIRTLPILAGRLAKQIEADSTTIVNLLLDPATAEKYGFKPEEFIGMFIPNTYEVWWTISPEALIRRMNQEYNNFWNESRIKLLDNTNLTQKEVSTLASIVYEETKKSDEMPKIAGVYINRLRRGMPLQADPTIKFALGNPNIRRILYRHLKVDSPYNTYKHRGLPPAPIYMPSVKSIDAVLNYAEHKYLYFCAKEDFSGYHNFARTLREHNNNSNRYSRALNRAGIR